MPTKPETTEPSTRLPSHVHGGERRFRRIVVSGGVGVIVLAAAIYGVARAVDARETAAREAARGDLGSCLLGPDPLKDGETPSARVARIKLGVVGIPLEKRAEPGELPWPASCGAQAHALAEHAAATPLGAAAEALAKALRADTAATAEVLFELDKVWAEADAAKVFPAPSPGAKVAPPPAALVFTTEELRALPRFLSGTFSLLDVREDPAPGTEMHFLVDRKDSAEGPVICTVRAADPAARCTKFPETVATLSPGVRLVGTTEQGARPFYFAGDRGQLGIFPPDGQHAIAAAVTYGASARADGSIGILMRKDGGRELHLVHQPAAGPIADQAVLPLTEIDTPTQAGMFWDWIVYRTLPKLVSPAHFVARKVQGPEVGPALDAGEIEEIAPMDKAERDRDQVSACKSDEAIAVRVRGQRGDVLFFHAGGRWSSGVKAATRGGALTCRGREAVITMVEHGTGRGRDYPTITQSRCSTAGCATTQVEVRRMLAGLDIAPLDSEASLAADVAGKLLFLWNAGPAGGLRMRLAPIDHIMEAEDVVVADVREEKAGASVSSISGMRVLHASGFAVVLLSTIRGVKALRVDSSTGKPAPLPATL
jgi:hypothetical protein